MDPVSHFPRFQPKYRRLLRLFDVQKSDPPLILTSAIYRLGRHRLLMTQFLRFAVVGVFGLLVDASTVYTLRGAIGIYGAGLVAYVVAASGNWLLNRLWTFKGKGKGPAHRQWALFLAANLIGFALNRGAFTILVAFIPYVRENPIFAVAAGGFAGMFVNFAMMRLIVFR